MNGSLRVGVLLASIFLLACGSGSKGQSSPDGGSGDMCTSNDDCGGGLICAGGFCQIEGTVGLGGACWATRDCGPDLFCRPDGVCSPAGEGDVGDECVTTDQCMRGLVCELFGFGGQCAEAGDSDIGDTCEKTTDCIAGLSCGPDGRCGHGLVVFPPFTGVECEEDAEEFKVYFEVPRDDPPAEFYRLPFPNDARVYEGELDIDDFPRPGKSLLGVDLVDLYADALAEDFAGFGAVTPVAIRFSREVDFDSIPKTAIYYVDLSPGDDYGVNRDRKWSYRPSPRLYHCQHYLIVSDSKHRPLVPGHTYAVYLTTDIRGADGQAPVQDDDFAALLGESRPGGDDRLGSAWDAYAPFRDYLADKSIGADTIAGAAVFTVAESTARAEALAEAVADVTPALKDLTLCDDGVTSPCEDSEGRGACGAVNDDFYEIHGRFTVPIFQKGTAPYETPDDGGEIAVNGSGVPQKQRDEDVCFALSIPKSAEMPAGGWPLVVYAHGTGGAFTGAMQNGVASNLATQPNPAAVFSYDGVVHGERKNGSMHSSDDLMFNVLNPRAARDNNLQGAVDVLTALRLGSVAETDLPGAGATSFDEAKIYYFGHSQGSNVGMPAVAVTDLTPAAILSGAGSHLARSLLTKTSPVDAKAALEFLIGEELSTDHPVMVIWQTFFTSVDTVNFAPLLIDRPPAGIPSKHIFMSWGQGDSYSPEPTLNATARAARLPIAEPVVDDLEIGTVARDVTENKAGRTAACFQYQPDGYDGHFVSTRNPDAVADWVEFLQTAITTGTPVVTSK